MLSASSIVATIRERSPGSGATRRRDWREEEVDLVAPGAFVERARELKLI